MGLVYELDLGNGKLKIELVKTKHFCRYCKALNIECIRRHRAGTIWFVKASIIPNEKSGFQISYTDNRYYAITDGEIPPETEHPEDYGINTHYTTGSGWIAPKAIVELSDEEFYEYTERIEQEPTEFELRTLMHRLLGKYRNPEAPVMPPRLLILTILDDLSVDYRDITKPELHWLKKVYKKWLDDSVKYYGGTDIDVIRVPRAFTEKVRFPTFGVEIDYLQKYNTFITEGRVRDTKIYKIFTGHSIYNRKLIAVYAKSGYRKVLYYYNGQWRGREKYLFHNHPECEIHPDAIRYLQDKMVLNRLGDVLFLDDDCIPEKVRDLLRPATKEQLRKITTTNAKIEEVGEKLKTIPENVNFAIQVTHPEHGTLELPPRMYTLYRVPYVEAGHD